VEYAHVGVMPTSMNVAASEKQEFSLRVVASMPCREQPYTGTESQILLRIHKEGQFILLEILIDDSSLRNHTYCVCSL